MSLIEWPLRPLIRLAARKCWTGSETIAGSALTRAQVDAILVAGWRRYHALRRDLPRAGSLGNRHVLILSAITLAFFQELIGAGLSREAAGEAVSQAVWELFRPIADLAWLAAKLRTRQRIEQVRAMMLLSLRYPFCPPGFESQVIPNSEGVRVDFQRCLAAEYLGAQGAADLCVRAWCQQDYRMAARWGVRLIRRGTRASGADVCDFDFVP